MGQEISSKNKSNTEFTMKNSLSAKDFGAFSASSLHKTNCSSIEEKHGANKTQRTVKPFMLEKVQTHDFLLKFIQFEEEAIITSKTKKYTLEDFEFVRLIGKGSYGKVKLAKNIHTDEYFAMKCFKKEFISQNGYISRLKREKRILNLTNNPFLINLNFTFQSKDKVFFAFDYYGGGDLYFHLQKKMFFSEEKAKFYAAQVYLALQYLHSKGIIYRDLKPENIVLDSNGYIKLIDFGLAKDKMKENSKAYTSCGTNEYQSPEAVEGKPYSFELDWWGFGILIYEMVCGTPPFQATDRNSLFQKILKEPLNWKGFKGTDALKDLLEGLLQKDLKNRMKSNDILRHTWFKNVDLNEIVNFDKTPPFAPFTKNEEDFTNIDPIFLGEKVISPQKQPVKYKVNEQEWGLLPEPTVDPFEEF